MKNIINDIKNIVKGKKEISTKDAFALMNKELEEAEKAYGKQIFPEDKVLSPEEVHYQALKLKAGTPFEKIKEQYAKLKNKYNPELFKDNETKYEKAKELDARVEFAYCYFKQKFGIE